MNASPPSSPNSDPRVFQKELEPFEDLWTPVEDLLDLSTALMTAFGDKVDRIYGGTMIRWVEDLNVVQPPIPDPNSTLLREMLNFGRPLILYPNSTVLENNSTLLREMLSEIDGLLMIEYDWDEIDYRKPTLEDINVAKDTLIKFVTVIGGCEGYLLTKPYISNSEDGGAKLEWHSGERSLYLRIDHLESVATKIVDTPDGTTTIDDTPFLQQSYLPLWKWLINE